MVNTSFRSEIQVTDSTFIGWSPKNQRSNGSGFGSRLEVPDQYKIKENRVSAVKDQIVQVIEKRVQSSQQIFDRERQLGEWMVELIVPSRNKVPKIEFTELKFSTIPIRSSHSTKSKPRVWR